MIDVKKYGIPETLEDYAKKYGRKRILKSVPELVGVLIFARERWTGLKHPLRCAENRGVLK